MDDLDDLGDKELIQSALRGDFELIAGYGEEHPGAWTGAWFDNEPTVRIVAAFTGDAARHDAALRPGSDILTGSSWRAGSSRSVVCGGYERRSSVPSSSEPRRPVVGFSPPSERERESSAWPCGPTRRPWPASSPTLRERCRAAGGMVLFPASPAQPSAAACRDGAAGADLRRARDQR